MKKKCWTTHKSSKVNDKAQILKKFLQEHFFFSQTLEVPTVKRCNKPKCDTCPYIAEGSNFHFKNGSKFTVKTYTSCISSNLMSSSVPVAVKIILDRRETPSDTE